EGRLGGLVAGPAPRVRLGVRLGRYPGVRFPAGGVSDERMVSSLERVAGRITAPRGERILGWATLVAMAASAVMSLVVSPPDAQQGNAARLLYIHVPSAWLAYLSFAVVFVASIAYLAPRRTRWDR